MPDFQKVPEAEAEGKTKVIFEDIKLVLGVASVGSVFEELAACPWYLQLAWRNLKPNASTRYFHRIAEEIEDSALRNAGRRGSRGGADDAQLSPVEARVDLDAKLLAAVAAIRYGTNGQLPKMLWLTATDKQAVAPVKIEVSPAEEPEPVAESKASAGLRQHAALAAESLPYRMEVSATACRQSGLTEDEIDLVREIVNRAWDLLPRTLLASGAGTSSGAKTTSTESVAAA